MIDGIMQFPCDCVNKFRAQNSGMEQPSALDNKIQAASHYYHYQT